MNERTRADQYDATDEDYVRYWDGRDYEHAAETVAVRRLLGRTHCRRAADIGGGFGRLSLVLQTYADEVTLLDTSKKQLEAAKEFVGDHPRIRLQLMRPAAFGLPDGSMAIVTMVRVMHHLPDPGPTLAEISRVLHPKGMAIIEVANLAHAVNRMRYLAHGRSVPRSPIDIRSAEKRAEGSIPFVNHHPASVVRQFSEAGLSVERTLSVSNLRHPALKRAFSQGFLLALERAMQAPLAPLAFGPSLFYLLRPSHA
ncbi:class I SAM-dependent methyltransferase [Streptomyces sp. NPDC048637]|uniref:class I SAM-dependent methyltransferase n=1 Tax=Streptomyces sp. NPDC048637 TaxID=3155636 RepID=UPI00341CFD3B